MTGESEDLEELTADQAAVRWVLRLNVGELSLTEAEELAIWREQRGNSEAFEKACRLWRAVDEISTTPAILHLRAQELARLKRRRTTHLAIAAGVCALAIGGSALLITVFGPQFASRTATVQAHETFATAVGQRNRVRLSDGSWLMLNTDSQARVVYSTTERRIMLDRGQAMFEVAKHQSRPFVVYAGGQRVVATGTAFDVRLKLGVVQVSLVEGHVSVGAANAAARSGETRLNPGQQLTVRGRTISVGAADVGQLTSWTSGKLIFRNTRLADAVEEVNRYSQNTIALTDPRLGELKVNGVFEVGQAEGFARAIAAIYPVGLIESADGGILLAPSGG